MSYYTNLHFIEPPYKKDREALTAAYSKLIFVPYSTLLIQCITAVHKFYKITQWR